MRQLLLLPSILASALAIILFGCAPPEDTSTSRAKILELDQVFTRAFNNKSADSIMMSYWNSPDLVAMYPDNMYRGYEAVKRSWQSLFAGGDVKKFVVTEDRLMVYPNVAYEWGTYDFDYQPKGRPVVSMPGRFLEVWEKKNGSWVITADHASSPTLRNGVAADTSKSL